MLLLTFTLTLTLALLATRTTAQVPEWPQTWQMNQSTILMVCNNTGYTDPKSTAGWSLVDFDWSNGKGTGSADGWAKHKPMDCEEMLVKQVEMSHEASPGTSFFIYRNAIKALPWYTSVREKLEDPAYAAWFLKFGPPTVGSGWHVPQCDNNYSPPLCTEFYHDQEQTPGFPHGDGDCSPPACDVGKIPVGEYLFDFRSVNVSVNGQTFAEWYINDYHLGPTGAGNPLVSGFYVDDSWGPGGPTEMEGHAVQDMGLTQAQVNDITAGYTWVTAQLYAKILSAKKFIWDQFLNIDPYAPLNGDCPQPWVKKTTCASDLRGLCGAGSKTQNRTLLYGFSPGSCTGTDPAHLTDVDQDVANFLLVRGPYAFLGNGWLGCSRQYEYPAAQFNADYGTPLGFCAETAPNSGVFKREFTKSTVQMNCATWTPTITFH